MHYRHGRKEQPAACRRGEGGGGWHDATVCFVLQPAAPIGRSPPAALPLDPFPPSAAVPIGLSFVLAYLSLSTSLSFPLVGCVVVGGGLSPDPPPSKGLS